MLSKEAQAYKVFMNQGFSSLANFDVESIRAKNERLHAIINKQLIGISQCSFQSESIKTDTNEISLTIYTPANVSREKLVIYYHGGGWIFGSRTTHQTIVQMGAEATRSVWISVEYRLAPENKFPIWLDDCVNAAHYIISNKIKYGGNTLTKIGVAGDSAGAIIAASVCLTLKESIEFQILIYGSFDMGNTGEPTASEKEFNADPFLSTTAEVKWVVTNAFADPVADVNNPRVSILRNDKSVFERLPPTLFIVAEIDPARDSSYVYHEVLKNAGVNSTVHVVKGVLHSFFSLPGLYREACKEALDVIRTFLDRTFNI